MFISCGKSGKSTSESEESSKPPTTFVGPKATKFTPQMVVAAFEKAANRMPPESKADMLKEIPLKDPAKMAEMTEEINEALASGKLELKEISVDALADYITELPKARGIGVTRHEAVTAQRGMAGLQMGQGQMVMMDGSAQQSSKDDIGEAGRRVKAHINSRGGQAKGNASTRMALPY